MSGFIFFHYLKRTLIEPIGLGVLVGLPVALIVILSSIFTGNFEGDAYANGYNMIATHIAVPMMISFQFFGSFILTDHLHADFRSTRKSRLFATPIRNSNFLIGAFLASLLASFIQGLLIVVITSHFLNAYFGNLWITFTAILFSGLAAQLLALIWFVLFPKKSTAEAFIQMTSWAMMIGSGLTFGSPEAPNAVQQFFMNYLPLSLGVNAIQNSGFINDYNMREVWINLALLIGCIITFAIIVLALSKKLRSQEVKTKVPSEQATPHTMMIKNRNADLNLHMSQSNRTHFTVLKFGMVRGLKNWVSLLLNMVLPIGLIFLPGLWSGDEARGFYFLAGSLMFGSLPACKSLLNDKLEGTHKRIHLAPISKSNYLVQSIISGFIPLFIPIIIVTSLGAIFYSWEFNLVFGLFLLYTLFTMANVALILAWRNLFSDKEASSAAFSVGMSLVAMLGGVWMPLEIMPNVLRMIGGLFPVYWVSLSISVLLNHGITWQFMMYLFIIIMFISAYTIFGIKGRKEAT